MTVVVDGERVVLDSDNAAEVAARADAIKDFLAGTDPQAQWVPCAIGVVGTVMGVAAANPWAIVTGFAAACTCLPLLVEEWEGESCPGFG